MDRLIALVGLRLRLEWRDLRGARDRAFGMGLATAVLMAASSILAVGAYAALRGLAAAEPEAALSVVSVAASFFGVAALLGPLLSGIAMAQSHDLSKLAHFPVRPGTLALASLTANLLQPLVLAQLPVFLGVSLGAARSPVLVPLTASGFALSYAAILVAAQIASLASHALQRSRRYRDAALFVGVAGGFLLSLVPLILLTTPGAARQLFSLLERSQIMGWLPFAYGARAAVHAGQGNFGTFVAFCAAACAAIFGGVAVASGLVRSIHRGELDLGAAAKRSFRRSLLRLPGVVGAVVEKDLRTLWRDPGLRASLVTGLVGPILFVYVLASHGGAGASGYTVLALATFIGASGLGGGAFGFERGSIAQLFTFPAARWKLLLAKNLSASIFKIPGFLTLAAAAALLAPLGMLPFVAVVAVVAFLMAAALDSYVSVRFPWTPPRPGGDPSGHSAVSATGMSRGVVALGSFLGAVTLSSPFAFLAWFPWLMGRPSLGLVTLPLALAGAAATYALLVRGAEALLVRHEQELIERVGVEARAG